MTSEVKLLLSSVTQLCMTSTIIFCVINHLFYTQNALLVSINLLCIYDVQFLKFWIELGSRDKTQKFLNESIKSIYTALYILQVCFFKGFLCDITICLPSSFFIHVHSSQSYDWANN